jgi:hypothetical protein
MTQDSNRSKVPQPKRIDELLKEFGFRPDAPVSTARALIVNLVRSAYGHEAAREFIRQMNLSENRDVKSSPENAEFQKTSVLTVEKSARNSHQKLDFLTVPVQLRLFDDTGTD